MSANSLGVPAGLSPAKARTGAAHARRSGIWLAAALLWAAAVATGFTVLLRYSSTAGGGQGAHPRRWPAAAPLEQTPGRATVLMFAHPHCPCTRASVAELARLMARFGDRLTAYVLVVQPHGTGDDWMDTALRDRAAAIPGVRALVDRGGVEAARFGALTSGLTLLYDRRGRLVFSGGLTASRGHEGPSFGQRRIVSLLTTGTADRHDAPVFGCALRNPRSARPARAHQEGMPHEGI
jgi:hypothetical protein